MTMGWEEGVEGGEGGEGVEGVEKKFLIINPEYSLGGLFWGKSNE